MNTIEFKKQQVALLRDGESDDNVKRNIIKHVFECYIRIATIDRIIALCMELYTHIVAEYNQPQGTIPE